MPKPLDVIRLSQVLPGRWFTWEGTRYLKVEGKRGCPGCDMAFIAVYENRLLVSEDHFGEFRDHQPPDPEVRIDLT